MARRKSGLSLGKLARALFKVAGLMTTASIVASGNPRRIARHALRKTAYKQSSKVLRKL
jgi:hypothetical protein